MDISKISYEIKDRIAYVGFGVSEQKSMTVLDEPTLIELRKVADKLAEEDSASSIDGVIFFSHKPNCFLAGADIKLIASMQTEVEATKGAESGQEIYNIFEDLKAHTIACVDGVALGGGMELVLSCKTILASDNPKTMMGLPEVKLGLLPGFGGTYRLPKRVGLPTALDMILSGKTYNGQKGKKIGLVDEVYPKENLLKMAPQHFKGIKKKETLSATLGHLAADNFVAKKIIFQKARESVMQKTKGFYHAPLKILEVMESGIGRGRSSYLSSEAQGFGELAVSIQSKNLQHIYFMTETVKKYPGPKGTQKLPELKRGGALGAGTMGGGIAWLMADNEMAPIMKDLSYEALELGLKQSASNFSGALKRRKITRDEYERKQRSIQTQLDYRGFKKIDLLIEAVVENMDVKKKVFSEVEKQMRPDAIITSNTSSLSVNEMSQALEFPERFAGLHFFNPVHLMPLVEIITHDRVSPQTLESLYNWVLKTKKTPVIVKDGPGFLVNRILMPYLNEAAFLLLEGVSIRTLDEAALNFGMPMGPCRLMDEVGIDVASKVAKILHKGLGDRAKPSELSHQLEEEKILGKKNGKGFYLYDNNGKEVGLNPDVEKFLPTKKIKMEENEIWERFLLPMINEASIILSDGIVKSAMEVDLGLIFGMGFPPFRGGLLKYADAEGLSRIIERLNHYSGSVDKDRYQASSYLRGLVDSKKRFYEA